MPTYHEHRLPVARKTARLLRLLCQKALTPSQLAKHMGMGQSQVYRYVWALQKEGVPVKVWHVEQNKYRYVLDKQQCWKWLTGEESEMPVRRKHARSKTA